MYAVEIVVDCLYDHMMWCIHEQLDQDVDTAARDQHQSSTTSLEDATEHLDSGVSDLSMEDEDATNIAASEAGKSHNL